MPYKDKEQRKQAQREWVRQKRAEDKGSTGLEQCRYCSAPLPALAKPRRNRGACYPCAMKQPRKPSIVALGDTVYAGAEWNG